VQSYKAQTSVAGSNETAKQLSVVEHDSIHAGNPPEVVTGVLPEVGHLTLKVSQLAVLNSLPWQSGHLGGSKV
jgi:hypothetical protein